MRKERCNDVAFPRCLLISVVFVSINAEATGNISVIGAV